ncbi:MAG: M28 family peptidase [Gemmatimonadaceae bacterium]|nr:M28 family peptidase [Gemmatimonadaceae bacterium]
MSSAIPRRAAYASVVAVLVGCHITFAPPAAPAPAAAPWSAMADTARIRSDIVYLASDALEGRGTGTPGNDSAAAYLAREYARLGLTKLARATSCQQMRAGVRECLLGRPTYLQYFSARSVAAAHAGLPGALPTQNVVAMQPGTDPALRGEYLVIGAHFDHLGRSSFNAIDPGARDAIRHGADDNASGTAAVLELARRFHDVPARRPIIFANFSGEELGDLGSEHFVDDPPVPLDSIDIMMNFDMVGRLRNDKLIVYGVTTATALRGIVDKANVAPQLAINAVGDGFGPSDHSSFYARKIPVLHFFTDLHEDYHRATDVASKINIPGEARVIDYAERIARDIANRPVRLTYVRSLQPPRQMPGGPPSATYFGSIPDMGAADIVGVKLAGTTPGSPADRAGAQAGDIIVEFGGKAVKDIYDFTAAIGAYRPGDVVQVIVVRAGRRLVLIATLGKRGF